MIVLLLSYHLKMQGWILSVCFHPSPAPLVIFNRTWLNWCGRQGIASFLTTPHSEFHYRHWLTLHVERISFCLLGFGYVTSYSILPANLGLIQLTSNPACVLFHHSRNSLLFSSRTDNKLIAEN